MVDLRVVPQRPHQITEEQLQNFRQRIAARPNFQRKPDPITARDVWRIGLPILAVSVATFILLLIFAAVQKWLL